MEKLRQAHAIEIVYRHFPLHPDTPKAGQTLEELFAGRHVDVAAAKVRMAQLMADERLPFAERTMTYNSRLAQEFAAWAVTQSGGAQVHDCLFRAYFVSNVNLAVAENLVSIAEQIGLSGDAARDVLLQRTHHDLVDADWQRCRELEITSVPTFVVGNRRLVGAQSYEQLAALVEST